MSTRFSERIEEEIPQAKNDGVDGVLLILGIVTATAPSFIKNEMVDNLGRGQWNKVDGIWRNMENGKCDFVVKEWHRLIQ